MAQLSPEQTKVLHALLTRAQKAGASPRELKALVEAGLVESNLRNLNYGDRDSLGVLQQRPSQGWANATNPSLAAADFLKQAQQINRGGFHGSAGQLAQAVQRSAFPGRYDQRGGQAAALIGGMRAGGVPSPGTGNSTTTTTSRTIPGVDNSQQRLALTAAYLANTHDPNALTSLAAGLLGAKDTPAQSVTSSKTTKTGGKRTVGDAGGDPSLSAIQGRAQSINDKQLPYQWGGGHQADVKPGQPLDCSGAVSRVLGVKAKVASEFKSWGKPGKGSNVTVYAKDSHVLMSIRGKDGKEHFWGTSQANPGGGAGWIPKSQISDDYLSGFVARHP